MTESIQSVTILGTGLIGASVGLALRANGFAGSILGWDRSPEEAETARDKGAIDSVAADPLAAARETDCVLLATPVFGILEWIERLAPVLQQHQLVTDVGSTKRKICALAAEAFSSPGAAYFLPGHPMAGKEVFGAANADANLFQGAIWLFTSPEPNPDEAENQTLGRQRADKWRHWVARMGCRMWDLDPVRHDEICAWASHLPQMLGTALAALLEDTFPEDGKEKGNLANPSDQLRAIGGRAMHEMTRLGASPYSMWRDIAQTNDEAIAAALLAMEQRLAFIRENLKHPELREQFLRANQFRSRF
ncbi:MAG: prephenate dehydrogenase [Acidobacteriaceae bacterium]